jgi:hypothetical protein
MPRRPGILNVRQHLEYVQVVCEAYRKYGKCPLVDDEVSKVLFITKVILRKHYAKRATGDRHDIHIERA